MKTRLNFRESVIITSMLFGMFFGAGNLIFPAHMGQMAGSQMWMAVIGFLLTGVGLPLLGIAALGISHSDGLLSLSQRAGKKYGLFFTCILYLTIGPFFAIPRCATVPFEIGVVPMLGEGADIQMYLAVFTLVFFGLVLWFSLRPGKILIWIGKVLNPIFLLILAVIILTALFHPMGTIHSAEPIDLYGNAYKALFRGFLDGYQTMDALAGLAFGIIVVHVVQDLGIKEPGAVAANTVRAGISSCLFMGVIYLAVTVVAAQSRGLYPLASNGGEALAVISGHYFGRAGILILAAAVVMACLKTAVGLITSCSETFVEIVKGKLSYKFWAVLFTAVSFMIANLGLNTIIHYTLPVLMFLYPLAITLIFLALFSRFWKDDPVIYRSVTVFTLIAAVPELFAMVPEGVQSALYMDRCLVFLNTYLPLFRFGMGWVCPALLGLGAGFFLLHRKRKKQSQTAL